MKHFSHALDMYTNVYVSQATVMEDEACLKDLQDHLRLLERIATETKAKTGLYLVTTFVHEGWTVVITSLGHKHTLTSQMLNAVREALT